MERSKIVPVNTLKAHHLPPVGNISFIHEGKHITFNPMEIARTPDHYDEALNQVLEQTASVGYWLSVLQKKYKDAVRERDIYKGTLYHQLKAEGLYATKYRGVRPTEDGLEHSIRTDQAYNELDEEVDQVKEKVDQLWNLARILERKHEILQIEGYLLHHQKKASLVEDTLRAKIR
jgi:hypothetical protein